MCPSSWKGPRRRCGRARNEEQGRDTNALLSNVNRSRTVLEILRHAAARFTIKIMVIENMTAA
jgi:translation initiation factor 2B subunit (eIF-2B alpha/beta/delta family)